MSAGAKYRLALLQKWEAKLSPERLATWRTLLGLLPASSPLVGLQGSYGLEVFLMGHVMRGASVESLRKFIPQQVRDRRMAAAGDAA